jgi:hypothetical protein
VGFGYLSASFCFVSAFFRFATERKKKTGKLTNPPYPPLKNGRYPVNSGKLKREKKKESIMAQKGIMLSISKSTTTKTQKSP